MSRLIVEPKNIGDVLAYNIPTFSFDVITIKSGEGKLEIGTIIAKNDAKEYVKCIDGAAAGADNARHILTEDIDATTNSVKTNTVARHASVKRAGLVFDGSFDSEDKIQAAFDKLSSHLIIVSEEQ